MPVFWQAVQQRWSDVVGSVKDAAAQDLRMREMRWWDRRQLGGTIAVTGGRGAGKSTLCDALLGKISQNYTPPGKSYVAEPYRVLLEERKARQRVSLVVVPGQASTERTDALGKMFDPRRGFAPMGLIHVVCWGHNKVWDAHERRIIQNEIVAAGQRFDLAAVLNWNRQAEMDEFRQVCGVVRDAWEQNPSLWMMVAVAQCHLFWKDIDEAAEYYIPRALDLTQSPQPAESEFRQELRDLIEEMRERRPVRLAVLPVSSYPAHYRFSSRLGTIRPALTPSESDNLVDRFRETLGEFCGQREA